jgi:hypothetical protein
MYCVRVCVTHTNVYMYVCMCIYVQYVSVCVVCVCTHMLTPSLPFSYPYLCRRIRMGKARWYGRRGRSMGRQFNSLVVRAACSQRQRSLFCTHTHTSHHPQPLRRSRVVGLVLVGMGEAGNGGCFVISERTLTPLDRTPPPPSEAFYLLPRGRPPPPLLRSLLRIMYNMGAIPVDHNRDLELMDLKLYSNKKCRPKPARCGCVIIRTVQY